MTMYTNTKSNTVKVMYQLKGKRYNVPGEASPVDNDKETMYPFDEMLVAPGATVDLGDVDGAIREVDMPAAAPAAPSRVGPVRGQPGDIVNSGPNLKKVLYKLDGKRYNVPGEASPVDNDKETMYPFDEAIVPVGEAFYNDADVVWTKVIDMPTTPDYIFTETNN